MCKHIMIGVVWTLVCGHSPHLHHNRVDAAPVLGYLPHGAPVNTGPNGNDPLYDGCRPLAQAFPACAGTP